MSRTSSLFLVATCLMGVAVAQPISPKKVDLQNLTLSDIINEIDSAQVSIILYSPQLKQQKVAEALRRAMVDRNLNVYIFTDTAGLSDAGSFSLSLAMVGWWDPKKPDAPRRGLMYFPKVPNHGEAFLILDSRRMLIGDLMGRPMSLAENKPTRLVLEAGRLRSAYNWAAEITRKAEPFNPYKFLAQQLKKGKENP